MESKPIECDSYNIKCNVGLLLSSSCFDKSLNVENHLFIIKEKLNDKQLELLSWRTGLQTFKQEDTICLYHLQHYITFFEMRQNSCCDPYHRHLKPRTKKQDLRKITLQKSKYYREKNNLILIPGNLLCSDCRKTLKEKNEAELAESDEDLEENDEFVLSSRIEEKTRINESLEEMNISPLKLQSVPSHYKKIYAKRKLKEAESQLKKKLSFVLNVDDSQSDDSENENMKKKETERKCNDIDKLVELMKIKLNSNLSKRETVQILTIAPQSWSRKRVATEFNVTEYMVRKARNLTLEKGILAMPSLKEGNKISHEVIEIIQNFYEDDEYSMMMPGSKDKISVKKNEYKQKRLLLCNLKELYFSFRQKYPATNISFSKFCCFRPKWCVLAGSPGTHTVCVCVIHQNVYLLAYAINLHNKEEIHQLMDKIVCNREHRACMLRYCSKCPSNSEPLKSYLRELLNECDDDDEVQFSQWINDGRMKLQAITLPIPEFIDLISEKVEALIPYSYISRMQNVYFKSKNNCRKL